MSPEAGAANPLVIAFGSLAAVALVVSCAMMAGNTGRGEAAAEAPIALATTLDEIERAPSPLLVPEELHLADSPPATDSLTAYLSVNEQQGPKVGDAIKTYLTAVQKKCGVTLSPAAVANRPDAKPDPAFELVSRGVTQGRVDLIDQGVQDINCAAVTARAP